MTRREVAKKSSRSSARRDRSSEPGDAGSVPGDARPALPDVSVAEVEQESEQFTHGELTIRCSPSLRGTDRRQLRGLGHHLQPVVQIGHQGLHDGLALALDEALLRHELIKVRVLETCPSTTAAVALWCHRIAGAQVAQVLGRTILLFRPHPDKPGIRLGTGEKARHKS